MNYLSGVKDTNLAVKLLKENLPNCQVNYISGNEDVKEKK